VAEKARTTLGVLVLPFGVSRAAMFAEPAVAEIEKVVCLIQEYQRSENRGQKSAVRKLDFSSLTSDF